MCVYSDAPVHTGDLILSGWAPGFTPEYQGVCGCHDPLCLLYCRNIVLPSVCSGCVHSSNHRLLLYTHVPADGSTAVLLYMTQSQCGVGTRVLYPYISYSSSVQLQDTAVPGSKQIGADVVSCDDFVSFDDFRHRRGVLD